MAGGISDGIALRAAQALGCDLGYMGTAFIATQESSASAEYKHLLLTATLDDVELTMAANGVAASTIKGKRASAGHSVSGVTDVLPVADLVERTFLEWSNAAPAGGSGLPHS